MIDAKLVEKVAKAIYEAQTKPLAPWGWHAENVTRYFYRLARAAIKAMEKE